MGGKSAGGRKEEIRDPNRKASLARCLKSSWHKAWAIRSGRSFDSLLAAPVAQDDSSFVSGLEMGLQEKILDKKIQTHHATRLYFFPFLILREEGDLRSGVER